MTKNIDYKLWKNRNTTNCFAFVMGLDIPEKTICPYAYNLGTFAFETGYKKYSQMKSFEEEFRGDLEALGIPYETSKDTGWLCNIKRCDGRYIDILFFIDDRDMWDMDFHFARFGKDGKLYHKWGFSENPSETTIKEIEDEGYEFVRRYRLFLSKKPKKR